MTAPTQRPKCVLYYKGMLADHCSQIVTGFFDLAASGAIELTIASEVVGPGAAPAVVDATVDGANVRYDLRDGYNLNAAGGWTREDLVQLCVGTDVVFKRSFDPQVQQTDGQGLDIRPLGLNYQVTSSNVPFLGEGPKNYIKHLVRRSRIANALLPMSHGRSSWVEQFEAPPDDPDASMVLFLARTWDPAGSEVKSSESAEDRWKLNEIRATCIRACRETFGAAFLGGFARLEHALREYPDCVVPKDVPTDRRAFLKAVRRASVCVATTGLHGSIGWKMAEYVAASRPIVSEPLRYLVPGGFGPGRNYLEFTDPETLVAAIDRLLKDRVARTAMARTNAEYYRGWVRPDALVGRTIREVLLLSAET